MRQGRWIIGVAAVLLALGAGWWFASPWWALKAMREAANRHDAAALSARVDYPALRESLKGEMRRKIMGDAGGADGGLGAVGNAVVMMIAGPMIDTMVTPEGIEAMFREEARRKGSPGDPSSRSLPHVAAAGDQPVIERNGLSEFRVHGKNPAEGNLVFHLEGLKWKLAGVALPRR